MIMTKNQIAYQDLAERARSNRRNEELTEQRDAETKRHYLASEFETNRANTAREIEDTRSHRAQELETNRSNLAKELETSRSNQAREQETYRSNVARENETNRANLESERLKDAATKTQAESNKYSADRQAESNKYSADKRYDAAVDSAYIKEYGVSPTDVKAVTTAVGQKVKQVATNPKVVSQAVANVDSAIKGTTAIISAPKVAASMLATNIAKNLKTIKEGFHAN